MPPASMTPPVMPQPAPAVFLGYGGFWLRVVAAVIDGMIVSLFQVAIGLLIGMLNVIDIDTSLILVIAPIGLFLLNILYFVLSESSTRQATIGKRMCGLAVTTESGNRITFGRALGRYAGKILSSLTLGIGFIMVAFTEKKQGLHDLLAKTVVAKQREAHVGRIILLLIGIVSVCVIGAFFFLSALLLTFVSWIGSMTNYTIPTESSVESSQTESEPSGSSTILLSEKEYDRYLSANPALLASQLGNEYEGSKAFAGPGIVYFDGAWLDVVMPIIPNLEDQHEESHLVITHIWSKSGKDIHDAKSSFEEDLFFTDLNFSERSSLVPHLHASRNIHLVDTAKESDIARIEGTIILALPINEEEYFSRSYPFSLIITQ